MLTDNESNWIVGAQIPAGYGEATGAFRLHPAPIGGLWRIHPYEANVAAWGILHGGPQYVPAVRAWLQWYMDHMDPETGYVCDYIADPTTYEVRPLVNPLTDERFCDSTDACSATFLTACRKYAEVTNEKAFLKANKHAVWAAVRAMESTRRDDGLTEAKPGRPLRMLANNCEVYQALHDVSWLCANVYADDACDAARWVHAASAMGNEITARFWDHSHDMFVTSLDTHGNGESSDWSVWHDATAQMWPVLVALDPWPEEFDAVWPSWASVADNIAPGAMIAYAAALTGRHDAAREWLRSAQRIHMREGHALPWTIREAAFTVATAWLEDV